jgi:hypothetical protein
MYMRLIEDNPHTTTTVTNTTTINITTTITITTTSTVNKFQNIGITYVTYGTSIPPDSSWLPHNLATLAQPSDRNCT